MDLRPHVDNIHRQLVLAAEAGGENARALAERLVAPLDSAIRLTLQDVLTTAAEEITCELAPGSVELRLRGRDPEFVVTPPPVDTSVGDLLEGGHYREPSGQPTAAKSGGAPGSTEGDDGAISRINLRMTDHLKARVEQAAGAEGLSVNSWLVRATAAALDRTDGARREPRAPQRQRYTGWAR